ncbi:MAG: hypothetical protein J5980_01205 [Muribaculaceae bacterium]|nr:hypothetical protein [Muribaculaceae bacterium]
MKKIFIACMACLTSLCALAYNNLDSDEIMLTDVYINKENNTLVEKAVTIFGQDYKVEVSNIVLSPIWFHCNIVIKNVWSSDDYLVTQRSDDEDFTEAPQGRIRRSTIETSLHQNYDLMIDSWMHLKEITDYGTVEIVYTIYDADQKNAFDLILKFPYNEHTITAVNDIHVDNQPVEYYDLNGMKLAGPRPGIVIEKRGDCVTKKVVK